MEIIYLTVLIKILIQAIADPLNVNSMGIIAIVLFILKEIFSFVKGVLPKSDTRNELDRILSSNVSHIRKGVEWLKEAHDVKDEDGKYIWYVSKSLENSMKELSKAVRENTNAVKGKK